MITYQSAHDISVILGKESINYPGEPVYTHRWNASIAEGDGANVSHLSMTAHAGTHVDLPLHFIPGKEPLDDYPAGSFILPASVIDIEDAEAVRASELRQHSIQRGEAVLFKTRNSRAGLCASGEFTEGFVYIAPDAAALCVEKGIALIGIDYISIDPYGSPDFPAHHTLLGNGVLALEGINLQDVPPGRYTLICLPLRIHGGEAFPVRAILLS